MKKSESDGDGKKRRKKGNEQNSDGDGKSDKKNTNRKRKREDKSTDDVKKSESDGDGKSDKKNTNRKRKREDKSMDDLKKSESDGDGKKCCKKGNEEKSGASDRNKNNTDREIKEEDKSTEDVKKSESDEDGKKGKKRRKKGNEEKSGTSDGNKNNTDREIKQQDTSTDGVKKSKSDGDGKRDGDKKNTDKESKQQQTTTSTQRGVTNSRTSRSHGPDIDQQRILGAWQNYLNTVAELNRPTLFCSVCNAGFMIQGALDLHFRNSHVKKKPGSSDSDEEPEKGSAKCDEDIKSDGISDAKSDEKNDVKQEKGSETNRDGDTKSDMKSDPKIKLQQKSSENAYKRTYKKTTRNPKDVIDLSKHVTTAEVHTPPADTQRDDENEENTTAYSDEKYTGSDEQNKQNVNGNKESDEVNPELGKDEQNKQNVNGNKESDEVITEPGKDEQNQQNVKGNEGSGGEITEPDSDPHVPTEKCACDKKEERVMKKEDKMVESKDDMSDGDNDNEVQPYLFDDPDPDRYRMLSFHEYTTGEKSPASTDRKERKRDEEIDERLEILSSTDSPPKVTLREKKRQIASKRKENKENLPRRARGRGRGRRGGRGRGRGRGHVRDGGHNWNSENWREDINSHHGVSPGLCPNYKEVVEDLKNSELGKDKELCEILDDIKAKSIVFGRDSGNFPDMNISDILDDVAAKSDESKHLDFIVAEPGVMKSDVDLENNVDKVSDGVAIGILGEYDGDGGENDLVPLQEKIECMDTDQMFKVKQDGNLEKMSAEGDGQLSYICTLEAIVESETEYEENDKEETQITEVVNTPTTLNIRRFYGKKVIERVSKVRDKFRIRQAKKHIARDRAERYAQRKGDGDEESETFTSDTTASSATVSEVSEISATTLGSDESMESLYSQTERETVTTVLTDRTTEDGNNQDTGYSSSKSKETKKEKQCKKKKKTKWERDRIKTVPVQQPSERDESDGSDSESVQ